MLLVPPAHIASASYEAPIEGRVLDPTLERIAACESNNIATAKNPNSSASGRFQFIRSSWEHYGRAYWGGDFNTKDVFNFDDNTELAYWVMSQNGYRDWEASAQCWRL